MRELKEEVESKGLLFLNECGLDPGIDHMSAMEIIDSIKEKGGQVTKFNSFCGGLVADEYDDNPFKYKISWNPRNVVLAGKGTSRFLKNGREVLKPYHRLFAESCILNIPGLGEFESYPNRDSLPYASIYGIEKVEDLMRGTLRKSGFCQRWNAFVQLGLTEDETILNFPEGACYSDYLKVFIPDFQDSYDSLFPKFVESKQAAIDILDLGFREIERKNLKRFSGTPADFLLDLIVDKWVLQKEDKDLIVMVHIFEYLLENVKYQIVASFGLKGENLEETAMAKTVGLPLGIVAKLLFQKKIPQKGLLLPLYPEIYKPVLKELSSFGINFSVTTDPLH
jgi:saccharopine dehydrogenase (NADP+, L-glutamate forming)